MKHKDLFCASPASTAICSSMGKRAIVHQGTRRISRSHLTDPGPEKTLRTAPCISQLPFDPKAFTNHQKGRKSSAQNTEMRGESSANVDYMASPARSSRFHTNDNPIFELVFNTDTSKALVPIHKTEPPTINSNHSLSSTSSSALSHSSQISSNNSPSFKSFSTCSQSRHQVVELRVSIHCKGCEGKVKKHISRMEGVTSFSIDMELKKVTVIGDVTPQGVLASISRVKNAQIWPA